MDAGVDWITATARDARLTAPLALQGRLAIALERDRGNLERPWKWGGYEGVACGSATVAKRVDGTIVRLSSTLAAERWRYLLRDADNVSRLDLQVTIFDPDPHVTHASVAYAQSTLAKATTGRPWGTTLIVTDPRGSTCYIGSRSSDKYGRIYDKGAESKRQEESGRWRYEVEYKREVATRLADSLAACAAPLREGMGLVGSFFRARGVKVPFQSSSSIDEPSASRAPSDTERTLRWMREQVRPAVLRLVCMGYEKRTLIALGLPTVSDDESDPDEISIYRRVDRT